MLSKNAGGKVDMVMMVDEHWSALVLFQTLNVLNTFLEKYPYLKKINDFDILNASHLFLVAHVYNTGLTGPPGPAPRKFLRASLGASHTTSLACFCGLTPRLLPIIPHRRLRHRGTAFRCIRPELT